MTPKTYHLGVRTPYGWWVYGGFTSGQEAALSVPGSTPLSGEVLRTVVTCCEGGDHCSLCFPEKVNDDH